MTPLRTWTGTPLGVALTGGVSAALLAVLAILSASLQFFPSGWLDRAVTPIEHEANAAARYQQRAELGQRRVQMRNSLARVARPGLVITVDPPLPSDAASVVEARLRSAWNAFGISAPRVPIVLQAHAGVKEFTEQGDDVPSFAALPLRAGDPCIVMIRMPKVRQRTSQLSDDALQHRQLMFGCSLFARYGDPGAGLRAELQRIGWTPEAMQFRPEWYYGYVPGTHATINSYSAPESELACRAGRVERCAEVAARQTRRLRENAPGMSRAMYRWGSGYEGGGESLLAFLQVSVPAAQFQQIWQDDRPFATAVEAVTGQPMGVWVHRAMLRNSRPMVAAFSPTQPLVLRALFFTLLAAAVSMLAARWRTVE